LGGEIDSFTKKANEASPINWISKENELPIYLYQGNAEKKVPMHQTDLFYNLTKKSKFKDVYYQKIINGSKRNLQRDSKINKLINSRIEDLISPPILAL